MSIQIQILLHVNNHRQIELRFISFHFRCNNTKGEEELVASRIALHELPELLLAEKCQMLQNKLADATLQIKYDGSRSTTNSTQSSHRCPFE